jgi:hypothetical protein
MLSLLDNTTMATRPIGERGGKRVERKNRRSNAAPPLQKCCKSFYVRDTRYEGCQYFIDTVGRVGDMPSRSRLTLCYFVNKYCTESQLAPCSFSSSISTRQASCESCQATTPIDPRKKHQFDTSRCEQYIVCCPPLRSIHTRPSSFRPTFSPTASITHCHYSKIFITISKNIFPLRLQPAHSYVEFVGHSAPIFSFSRSTFTNDVGLQTAAQRSASKHHITSLLSL